MTDLPTFEEVHVLSDLHMGGCAGAQVFCQTGRLANYIERLTAQRPDGTLALVLNGDVFDTLAEDIPGYIAADEAVATVSRIVHDPSFEPVWGALAGFVRRPGRSLVFVIGNHDLEIALPGVQRLLWATLAGDDLQARARVGFSTTGAGFACRVGAARVFCTHGNEVDGWNYNRYEDLATLGRRLDAGLSMGADEWRPNAGTRMVKEVMNDIKRRYAWIDLLKPENSAAVGALLALDPARAGQLVQLAGLIDARRRGEIDARGRLSGDDYLDAASAPGSTAASQPDRATRPARFESLLGANLRACLAAASGNDDDDDDDLLAVAERHLEQPNAPSSTAQADAALGLQRFAWERLRGVSRAEALRHALRDWLADDKSFEIAAPDEAYRRICATVGPAVDFLVTGHTHLEKAIDRGHGRYYFNTGTWMRLLRLTPALLASGQAFAPVWQVLGDGRLPAIDDARFDGEPFVLNRTSAVAIRLQAPVNDAEESGNVGEGNGREDSVARAADDSLHARAGRLVVGELLHVEGDGRGAPRVVQRFVKECAG